MAIAKAVEKKEETATKVETVKVETAKVETVKPSAKEAKAPKKEAAAPKKEVAAPKKEAAAPKKEAAAPKKEKAPIKKDESKATVTVEFMGKAVSLDAILADAKKAFTKANKGIEIKTIDVYVKPEESVAYYVVNGVGSDDYKIVL